MCMAQTQMKENSEWLDDFVTSVFIGWDDMTSLPGYVKIVNISIFLFNFSKKTHREYQGR